MVQGFRRNVTKPEEYDGHECTGHGKPHSYSWRSHGLSHFQGYPVSLHMELRGKRDSFAVEGVVFVEEAVVTQIAVGAIGKPADHQQIRQEE